MNVRIEEINYFGGVIAANRLESLSGITEKEVLEAGSIKLLEVAYGENRLFVVAGIENDTIQVSITSPSAAGQTIQKRKVHQVAEIIHEIQFAVYSIVKTANCCPQIFCFFWQEAGDYAAQGMFSSPDEAAKKMKLVERAQCGFAYGKCRRNVDFSGGISNLRDYYEPCEPRLKKNGLPELYFARKEKNNGNN